MTFSSQVAVLAPTTLLARQHAETFSKRFAGTGVVVSELSRLVPPKQAREVRRKLAAGEIDIVVGTHALLAKDMEFANLSLLIVDEEQRFGVKQKERLKQLRATCHVLSMTATPIPRTLQLSLAGIRDLSIIATPPVDRLAVRTYVMPFDGLVIREALLREHFRGGRTFYVCPRFEDLAGVQATLRELVPEIKTIVAHGQMPPDELDNIMQSFCDGKYDVLISTTIVEAGLDIPQANTLVIHRADMYGLAQLYQLRGRVGRSKVRAYAYLTLPPRHRPTKQAMKRLEVMQKLDTLGAGFSLASHDMDIRGFGNLLGDEQSGNVREVGVELYQEMLKEAVEALRAQHQGAKTEGEKFSAKINLGLAVLIPPTYVQDMDVRLGLYRRIGLLASDQEIDWMTAELADRFGTLPSEVENLLAVMRLKLRCEALGVDKLDAGALGASLHFRDGTVKDPTTLLAWAAKHPSTIRLRPDGSLTVTGQQWEKLTNRVRGIEILLQELGALPR